MKKENGNNFSEEFEKWDKKSNVTFTVGEVSEVMKSIGIRDGFIKWDASKIKKILEKHEGMTERIIKSVPEILKKPTFIMESIKQYEDNRILFVGEVKDSKGYPVLAVLILEPTKSYQEMDLEIIKIASAYGKDNNLQVLLDRSKILYVEPNKNRTNKWLQVHGLQLPSRITTFGSIHSISYSDHSFNMQDREKIVKDIRKEGFVATKKLVNGIERFNERTGKYHTLREIHSEYKADDFCDSNKSELLKSIGKECREQEIAKTWRER